MSVDLFFLLMSADIEHQMSLQTFVWAISFPIGMVLGLSKSVPPAM